MIILRKEYQKTINLLENKSNQSSKFKARNLVKINDESIGKYNVNSEIRFKNTMLKSSLCDYSDSNILVKRAVTIVGVGADDVAKEADEGVISKNC